MRNDGPMTPAHQQASADPPPPPDMGFDDALWGRVKGNKGGGLRRVKNFIKKHGIAAFLLSWGCGPGMRS